MIYIHAKYHHNYNSLLVDRSYILFIFGSWHSGGPPDALVRLILSSPGGGRFLCL